MTSVSPEMSQEWKIALSENPRSITENYWFTPIFSMAVLTASALLIDKLPATQTSNILLMAMSAGVTIASDLLDSHSTTLALRADKIANSLGIVHPVEEANPTLGTHPEEKDLFTPKQFIISSALLALGIASPLFGVTFATARLNAVSGNYRNAKRLNRAIEISSRHDNGACVNTL